ncbi:Similar to Peptidyl-prolyl cis-trans isomerase ssp-1; acc. no. O60045 [Pyronema omphalodes CBS 100304]|uniref:Peptidyl-prolyl cis-trans isomerase n=1 Tax=Pyronema omphalodes (strain CBS 100304) TaxID=1076935 RepID=U4L5Z1_PYROM|nr:Similar to Peptidyl-prolyl cis-trans isomerase ssp-1; acc. no. O60045 [Pyronema omphalodes CBS 100304]
MVSSTSSPSLNPATGLPTGWVVKYSTSKVLPYYYYSPTNTSQWEPPRDCDHEILKHFMAANYSLPGPLTTDEKGDELRREGRIRCAHLLVKHRMSRRASSWKEAEITRLPSEANNMILQFERRIRAGEMSLGDLAVSESDCSSARRRGDLGWFGRNEMQREFEDAAFSLEPGEMSHPIETVSGMHLIERLE